MTDMPHPGTHTRRLHTILPAAAWPLAGLTWLAHTSGLLPSENASILAFTWLLAAGCLGAPVGGLRMLGKHLTRPVCNTLAAFCVALASLLTYLYASGALHPSRGALYASLLATMAPAVHAYNVSRWLERQSAAHQAGVRAGRAMESHDGDRRDQVLKALIQDKDTAELNAWIEVLQDVATGIEAQGRGDYYAQHTSLGYKPHLVRNDDERRAGNG